MEYKRKGSSPAVGLYELSEEHRVERENISSLANQKRTPCHQHSYIRVTAEQDLNAAMLKSLAKESIKLLKFEALQKL